MGVRGEHSKVRIFMNHSTLVFLTVSGTLFICGKCSDCQVCDDPQRQMRRIRRKHREGKLSQRVSRARGDAVIAVGSETQDWVLIIDCGAAAWPPCNLPAEGWCQALRHSTILQCFHSSFLLPQSTTWSSRNEMLLSSLDLLESSHTRFYLI